MKLINFMKSTIRKSSKSEKINIIIKNFSEKMGFKSNEEFQDYLKIKNININDLKKSL